MSIGGINPIQGMQAGAALERVGVAEQTGLKSIAGSRMEDGKKTGTVFEDFLHSAMEKIQSTNRYLSAAENEEIRWALGETDNTHDLTIALQKASTALQYTIAVRDKMLEAYKEIMQMQI